MIDSWKAVTVGDLCDTISETYKGIDDTVILVNTSDVLEGAILNHERVPNRNLKGQFKKTFQFNDILYSEIRPMNKRFAFVDFPNTNGYIASTKLMVLRPKPNLVIPEFLFNYLKSQPVIDKLQYQAEDRSATFPQITFSGQIAPLPLMLPDIKTQEKITSVIRSIENKIIYNTRINKNLEWQAMLLFKSHFIDFADYSREMVEAAEVGKVPCGWRTYHLSDFFPVVTGKKNANVSSSTGKYPFFSCSQDFSWTDEYSFDGDAILVAGNGEFNVKFYKGKFEAYQRTYVLIPHDSRFTAWLYYAVKYNLNIITSAARGSVIKFITKGMLEDFAFSAPSNLEDERLIDLFSAYNRIITENNAENLHLATIRDALLPKLMSGEIDVSAIDL